MRTLVLLLAAGLVLTSCEPTSTEHAAAARVNAPPRRYFVTLDAKAVASTPVERLAQELAARNGATLERVSASESRPGFVATMPEVSTLRLMDDPRVRFLEEVRESVPQEPRRSASMLATADTTTSTTPVTLSIYAPANGATVTGTVELQAGTSNGSSLSIDFFLDGKELPPCGYPCKWDTRSTPNGVHTLTARAWDDDYNEIDSAPVSITVDQDLVPPTVTLLSPTSDVTVGESFTVQARATDDRGQVLVRVFMDGRFYDVLSLGLSGGTVGKTLSTQNLTNGPHTMNVEARDPSDNVTFSQSITVTVDRDVTPPSVALTSPTSAVTVTGDTLALAADATDDRGLAKVVFLLDGTWVGEATAAPFTATFSTYGVLNGDYTLVAKAYD